ncbi:4'-phosphopantetheinyl transferase superfamily protein [Streptomyces sp. RS10V-4]|uniref:4'-phosphopantetheinyl transferase family protein n=1 Tax=Streptomyces rhizoryzae TaxID=2932493 RepID=UPI0020031F48|nr:4'-phosphopantetheinyl transferase superfamily protein [Streptomyces rhizoryzae]MCK7622620.1 4'-phosphopantetheinyl transferase superfamily protein [Streptomyces rhizoryzae]
MTRPIRVADRVWVATTTGRGGRPGPAPASRHRDDLRRAAALPEWRAREFLAGRGLLRELLAAVRPDLADAEIAPGPRGRPGLRGHPGVGVSVSHTEGGVAAGVAVGRAVGVDLQHPADRVGPALARRLLPGHVEQLAALPPERAAAEVAWVWTAQEACVKASGAGLAGRPWTIDVAPGARTGHWAGYRWTALRDHSTTPLSCAYTAHTG